VSFRQKKQTEGSCVVWFILQRAQSLKSVSPVLEMFVV